MSLRTLQGRDVDTGYDSNNTLVFGFFVVFSLACALGAIMIYLRKRRCTQQAQRLPMYQRRGHQRSPTITTTPTHVGSDKIFVYDKEMNLISKPHGRPDSPVPEIRVTFPDEMDQTGQKMSGRVVVVHITETGSVGMSPLPQEQLPPYQQADSGRFQSLELDRLGGLREGQAQRP